MNYLKRIIDHVPDERAIKHIRPYDAANDGITEEQYYAIFQNINNVMDKVLPCILAFIILFPFLNKVSRYK
jgi:hypothetical protein